MRHSMGVLAAVVLGACAPPPGDVAGRWYGTVRDGAGVGVAGALVTARWTGSGRAVTVYTDTLGRYALPPGLPEGAFTLEARGPSGGRVPRATATSATQAPTGTPTDLLLGAAEERDEPAAAGFLAQIPDGPEKRRFVVDCGGCHTFNSLHARKDGRDRTAAEWEEAIGRMAASFGQGTGFPILSSAVDPERDGAWLAATLAGASWPESPAPPAEATAGRHGAVLTEYDVPVPQDLPHDLAVDGSGRVVITGMFTHRLYVLDPGTARFDTVGIPVPNANPRAVDIDAQGRWWALLGGPRKAVRYDPVDGSWAVHDLGTYPHSVAFDSGGRVWFNGHFSVAPEIVGVVEPATGEVRTFEVPPSDARWQGESTVPYGLRVGPDDLVWGTQLRGNGLVRLDPASGEVRRWEMPTAESGPRRPDVGPDGIVWIPEFGANRIARFDPATETFTELDFPTADASPYVVRVDPRRGTVWIGTGHGDVVAALDPRTLTFTLYPLPTRGALVRHIDVDERTGDLWAAYGASPGIPGKILRIQRP